MTEQWEAPLKRANEIKNKGAKWRRMVRKRDVVDGRLTLAETLEANGFLPEVGALRLRHFLTAAFRMGDKKASKLCEKALLIRREDPRIRDLTLPERSRLAAELRENARLLKIDRARRSDR